MPSYKESCKTCRYFDSYGYERGACNRYPPQWRAALTDSISSFPTVDSFQWCGEYKPRENQKKN